jgi:hypothetical protein
MRLVVSNFKRARSKHKKTPDFDLLKHFGKKVDPHWAGNFKCPFFVLLYSSLLLVATKG